MRLLYTVVAKVSYKSLHGDKDYVNVSASAEVEYSSVAGFDLAVQELLDELEQVVAKRKQVAVRDVIAEVLSVSYTEIREA